MCPSGGMVLSVESQLAADERGDVEVFVVPHRRVGVTETVRARKSALTGVVAYIVAHCSRHRLFLGGRAFVEYKHDDGEPARERGLVVDGAEFKGGAEAERSR